MVEQGLAPSRARAQAEIAAGNVLVAGELVRKPSQMIPEGAELSLKSEPYPWVSRGAEKLLRALEAFKISVNDLRVLDLGASTGGFTQVVLQQGAAHVYALDVGHGQLHASLQKDPRVSNLEGLHVKDLSPQHISQPLGAIVTDVSFISLKKALPPALRFAAPGCFLVALIKPQFEVGQKNIGRGGLVKDPELHQAVCADIKSWLDAQEGWRVVGLCDSPVLGGDGNKEFLIGAIKEK